MNLSEFNTLKTVKFGIKIFATDYFVEGRGLLIADDFFALPKAAAQEENNASALYVVLLSSHLPINEP